MKKRVTTKKQIKPKNNPARLHLKMIQPGKRLGELVSVYEDLERTLKRIKTTSLLHGGNSLMQINIQKLISQLSKSKRKIERKISHTLLNERTQIRYQFDKWAPKLGRKISKRNASSVMETQDYI